MKTQTRERSLNSDPALAAHRQASDLWTRNVESLAGLARQYHKDVTMFVGVSVVVTKHALLAALQAGHALQKLKCQVPRGLWTKALKNVVQIPVSSAYRYLDLAERYPTLECLPEGKSLTDLYKVADDEINVRSAQDAEGNDGKAEERRRSWPARERARCGIADVSLKIARLSAALGRISETALNEIGPGETAAALEGIDELIATLTQTRDRIQRGIPPQPQVFPERTGAPILASYQPPPPSPPVPPPPPVSYRYIFPTVGNPVTRLTNYAQNEIFQLS